MEVTRRERLSTGAQRGISLPALPGVGPTSEETKAEGQEAEHGVAGREGELPRYAKKRPQQPGLQPEAKEEPDERAKASGPLMPYGKAAESAV